MTSEFDFSRVGKRTPYKTPEGFFDAMEANVWKEVQRASAASRRHKTYRFRICAGVLAAAASIALLLVLHPFASKEQPDGFLEVEQAFANLNQEDQAYMLEVYQEDIFMSE